MATLAVMVHSNSQAEIDFFDLPVSDAHLWNQTKDPNRLILNPVVRVFLSTHLLAKMLHETEKVAQALGPDMSNKMVEAAHEDG